MKSTQPESHGYVHTLRLFRPAAIHQGLGTIERILKEAVRGVLNRARRDHPHHVCSAAEVKATNSFRPVSLADAVEKPTIQPLGTSFSVGL